jgi:hypothetical protein
VFNIFQIRSIKYVGSPALGWVLGNMRENVITFICFTFQFEV